MFSYNCEKCGREVPPAYSQCPDCFPVQPKQGGTQQSVPQQSVTMSGSMPSMGMTGTTGTWQAGPPQPQQWAPPAPQSSAPQAAPQWTPPPPAPPQYAAPAAAAPQPSAPPMSFPAPPQQYMPQPGQAQARPGTPGWVIALLVGGLLVLGGYVIIEKIIPGMRGDGSSTEVASAKSELPPPAGSAEETIKYLEVTGLRLSETKQKAQITMAVVNHAAAELSDVDATVVIRTTKSKPGDTPLAQLQLKLNSIPANGVRDISMPFPTNLRAYELPDWQFLTAEVVPRK